MPPPGYEPFLAMVLDEPRDDVPRLVYADWLDEHGDPRGEFIRLQIELAQIPPSGGYWERLNDRQSELHVRYYDIWLTELPVWARNGCEFSRGFVRDVQVWTHWEPSFGPELSAAAPVERLIFQKAAGALDEFAYNPGMEHLRELTFLDDRMTPDDLRVLCRSEAALAPLDGLQLMGMKLLDSGALMISLCPHLSDLRRLELVRCEIQHRGALVLTDVSQSRLIGLTWLDLSDNGLGNDALYSLTSSPMIDRLERLHWNDNALTHAAARLLADAEPARLTHLELAGNHIGDLGARVFLERFPNLHYLDLARNPLSRGMQLSLKAHYGERVRVSGTG